MCCSLDNLSTEERSSFTAKVIVRSAAVFEELAEDDRVRATEMYNQFVFDYVDRFLVVIRGSSMEIVEEVLDRDGDVLQFVRRNLSDTRSLLSNAGNAFNTWFGHVDRREKRGFGYYVQRRDCPNDMYNLFCGTLKFEKWPKDPLSADELLIIQPILDAFFDQLSESNQAQFDYNMDWIARKVQHPEIKSGVMVWFCGPQGSGKGMLFDRLIGKGIFGSSYLQVASLRNITGSFNSILLGKVLVMVDDAEVHASDKSQAESLKALITEPTMMIEMKHKDAVEVNAPVDLVGASNKLQPIFIEGDDRRFHMNRTSAKHAQDAEYFGPLAALISDPSTHCLFYRYLVNRDVTSFVTALIPRTALKGDVKVSTRPAVVAFLQSLCMNPLRSGAFSLDADRETGKTLLVGMVDSFHSEYEQFMAKFYPRQNPLKGGNLVRAVNDSGYVTLKKTTRRNLRDGATTSAGINAWKFESTLAEVQAKLERMQMWDPYQPS